MGRQGESLDYLELVIQRGNRSSAASAPCDNQPCTDALGHLMAQEILIRGLEDEARLRESRYGRALSQTD